MVLTIFVIISIYFILNLQLDFILSLYNFIFLYNINPEIIIDFFLIILILYLLRSSFYKMYISNKSFSLLSKENMLNYTILISITNLNLIHLNFICIKVYFLFYKTFFSNFNWYNLSSFIIEKYLRNIFQSYFYSQLSSILSDTISKADEFYNIWKKILSDVSYSVSYLFFYIKNL